MFGCKLSRSSVRLVVGLFVVGLFLPSLGWAKGFYYEATQTVVPQKKGEQTQWSVHGWVDGDSAKVEFLESSNPVLPEGSYLLTTDGGATMTLVDPQEKTYTRWDLEALFAAFGAVMESMDGLVNLDFTDLSSETLSQETGPAILGFSTRHVRYATGYKMKMKAMGMRRAWTVETVQDVWVTNDVDAPGLFVWLKTAPSTGDEDFDQMIRQEMSKIKGLALKVDATSTTTNKKGRKHVNRSTMEVTTLREEKVAASTFAIPSDYTEAEPEEEPSGLGGLKSIFGRKSG